MDLPSHYNRELNFSNDEHQMESLPTTSSMFVSYLFNLNLVFVNLLYKWERDAKTNIKHLMNNKYFVKILSNHVILVRINL